MDADGSLHRYGLRPVGAQLDQVRDILAAQTALEQRGPGGGDPELLKLCCVQLFNAGVPGDVLAIWRAKTASWAAHNAVDVQLLCGGGLARTKAYLSADGSNAALAALDYVLCCEAAGDFAAFSVVDRSHFYARQYRASAHRVGAA